jgi:hypothetical protein
MSGGPVGIGDRIGRTNPDIARRTCEDGGSLRQPDVPIGLIEDCLFDSPERGERLAWVTASATVDGASWTYVVALNTAIQPTVVTDALALSEIDAALAACDWALFFVVCPAGLTDVGNTTKYVTVSSSSSI